MNTSHFSPTAKNALNAFNNQDFSTAASLFSKAAKEYLSENQPLLAAEMRNNQSVSFLQANKPKEALTCLEGVAELFSESGDLHKTGITYGNKATAYQEMKEWDLAVDFCEKAATLLLEVGQEEEYIMVMNILVSIQMRRMKFFDAISNARKYIDKIPNPTIRQRFLRFVFKIYNFFTKLIVR